MSSRTVRATERQPVSNNQPTKHNSVLFCVIEGILNNINAGKGESLAAYEMVSSVSEIFEQKLGVLVTFLFHCHNMGAE